MHAPDYRDVMGILRLEDAAICGMFRCGSRVYGTATPSSDHDFVAVLAGSDGRRDLVFGDGCNVVIHTRASFQEALDHHSIFALECLFAPAPHRLKEPAPPFRFVLDRRKLADAASERARADYEKASKRLDEEPDASRKKAFHAIRVLWFALQVAREGRITDFEEAAELWEEIATAPISLSTWISYGIEVEACAGELEELALP
ncbi:MAG: hypothetical protein HOV80_04425 [Polyangiaceae bacterium]|nr:hypothetical protein [Polyangiaceae bacterium]